MAPRTQAREVIQSRLARDLAGRRGSSLRFFLPEVKIGPVILDGHGRIIEFVVVSDEFRIRLPEAGIVIPEHAEGHIVELSIEHKKTATTGRFLKARLYFAYFDKVSV